MAREAYITGIGQSAVHMKGVRAPLLLTLDALREALDDSGLTKGQIDGVATFPGRTAASPGFSPLGADDVIDAFGLTVNWQVGGIEQPAQLASIGAAAMAVKQGLCRHVLCFRTVFESGVIAKAADYPRPSTGFAEGQMQWLLPFNALSPACWTAQYAMRHVVRYGMTREQLAQIPINGSRNAMLNPRARAITKEPLTLDKYMAAKPISTPLCLYDCDRFSDGSTVFIVSAEDALDEVRSVPIRIAAMAGSLARGSHDQAEWAAPHQAGPDLWKRADYRVEDVDVAELYDGFSFMTIDWLEGLGFCGRGEGHRFIEGGTRIALDGELPLNTHGGQLGAGRLHGFGFAHEAVVQLRGAGGARQVQGDPKVAVAASGGGPMAAALLLTRD